MLSIRFDPKAERERGFIVELTKRSYPPAEGRDRDRKFDDEGAVDTIRYRMGAHELLAMAKEMIGHLSQEQVNELTEKRMYTIWSTTGLSIPWRYSVAIDGPNFKLIKKAENTDG